MTATDLLTTSLDLVHADARAAVDGLTGEQIAHRIAPEANSIGWIVWHTYRIQDVRFSGAAGLPQVWTGQGFDRELDLGFAETDTGMGHTSDQVGRVTASADQLTRYADAVHAQVSTWLGGLTDADLERVLDTGSGLTLGAMLVRITNGVTQHSGQAAYLRGLLVTRPE